MRNGSTEGWLCTGGCGPVDEHKVGVLTQHQVVPGGAQLPHGAEELDPEEWRERLIHLIELDQQLVRANGAEQHGAQHFVLSALDIQLENRQLRDSELTRQR